MYIGFAKTIRIKYCTSNPTQTYLAGMRAFRSRIQIARMTGIKIIIGIHIGSGTGHPITDISVST